VGPLCRAGCPRDLNRSKDANIELTRTGSPDVTIKGRDSSRDRLESKVEERGLCGKWILIYAKFPKSITLHNIHYAVIGWVSSRPRLDRMKIAAMSLSTGFRMGRG
jgi:hypothetical protein